MCEASLAINDRRKVGDEWREETTFVSITFWKRTAEVLCEYAEKGSPILVEGRLKTSQWEKDGKKYTKLTVVCDKMQLLSKKEGGNTSSPRAKNSSNQDDYVNF